MNASQHRLMAVFAHPDDESLVMGGALAKYASEGIDTHLLMATRGERGRYGLHPVSPGTEIVGKTREQELLAAAGHLGVKEVSFLDYMDGDLDKVDAEEIITKIALHIRRVRPQVIATFGPDGAYGHPDHVAISQFTTAAIVKAADPTFRTAAFRSYSVSKLYYLAWPEEKWSLYQATLKRLTSKVDGTTREVTFYPDWYITTRVDATAYWPKVWDAIRCHRTQMEVYGPLAHVSEAEHRSLWGEMYFYRVFSLVNGGRQKETDLFEGVEIEQKAEPAFVYTKVG